MLLKKSDKMSEKKVKPLTDLEVSIFMCRLKFAIWEENKVKIEEILKEVKIRYIELKKGGYYND